MSRTSRAGITAIPVSVSSITAIVWHYHGLPPGSPADALIWLVLATLFGAALGSLLAHR